MVAQVVIADFSQRLELGVVRVDRRVLCKREFVVNVLLEGHGIDTRLRHGEVDELKGSFEIRRCTRPEEPFGEHVDTGIEEYLFIGQERGDRHRVEDTNAAALDHPRRDLGSSNIFVSER